MFGSIALPWSVAPRRPEPRRMSQVRGLPFWQEKPGEIVIAQSLFEVNWRYLFDLVTDGGSIPRHVCLRILEDVEIRGMYAVALDVGDWPSGTNLELENHGRVQGAGGPGGDGGYAEGDYEYGDAGNGQDGSPGGTALFTRFAVTITNNSELWGGGGGGGAGGGHGGWDANYAESGASGGSGGGGGQGSQPGGGGVGGNATAQDSANATNGNNGSQGSPSSPGGGGAAVKGGHLDQYDGGRGGDGGGPGQNGSAGAAGGNSYEDQSDDDWGSGGSGGSAGDAVDGDSHITWDTTGDIQGSQVN